MQIITLEREISNKRKISAAEKRLCIEKDCRLNEFTVLKERQDKKRHKPRHILIKLPNSVIKKKPSIS